VDCVKVLLRDKPASVGTVSRERRGVQKNRQEGPKGTPKHDTRRWNSAAGNAASRWLRFGLGGKDTALEILRANS